MGTVVHNELIALRGQLCQSSQPGAKSSRRSGADIAKEIDAQRQGSDYSVTWTLNGVTTITPVPGLSSI